MDTLYPNLYDRFQSEGLCPICLMEMELAPRYTCANAHTVCYRCKPYYFACPTCQSPLEMVMPQSQPESSYSPPPTHFLPHPAPRRFHGSHPSAPPVDDFLHHERQYWPPAPLEDQELKSCAYAHLGCWVKVPEHLIVLHESRCQFRPHLEEENLPTDVAHKHDDLVECRYNVVGCKVKTSPWRISIHENYCHYKDLYEAMNHMTESLDQTTITGHEYGDPEEMVECKYRRYGCLVNMPRRRKPRHQEKCNYRKYAGSDDESSSENEYDPEEQIPCKWVEYGCRVRPKRARKEMHEEKCNYKMEECAFKYRGCDAMFKPARRYAHEHSCQFAD